MHSKEQIVRVFEGSIIAHIKDTVQRRDLHAVTLNMIIIVTKIEVVVREKSTVVL